CVARLFGSDREDCFVDEAKQCLRWYLDKTLGEVSKNRKIVLRKTDDFERSRSTVDLYPVIFQSFNFDICVRQFSNDLQKALGWRCDGARLLDFGRAGTLDAQLQISSRELNAVLMGVHQQIS